MYNVYIYLNLQSIELICSATGSKSDKVCLQHVSLNCHTDSDGVESFSSASSEIYLPVCDVTCLGCGQRSKDAIGRTEDSRRHQLNWKQVR